MKNLYTLSLVLLCAFVGKAQIINIPDPVFKAKLLAASPTNNIARDFSTYVKIDTNNDGEIQVSEAISILELYLDIGPIGTIHSLEGIKSFTHLESITCHNNQIATLDLSGMPHLGVIIIENNQISNLNLTGLHILWYLKCDHNQLTNLDLTGLSRLNELYCSYNQLQSLDLSSIFQEYVFGLVVNCTNNNLKYINFKMGKNFNFGAQNFLTNNPNLHYICIDDNLVAQMTSWVGPNIVVNSYCSFIPGGVLKTIQGNIIYDENNNGCDSNDFAIPNVKLFFGNGSNNSIITSYPLGNYSYYVQDGTYSFYPSFENQYNYTISPPNFFLPTVTFPNTASPFVQNFCVTAYGSHPDLEVVILPIGAARPGFDAKYKIVYKNKGTNTQSGSINFTFDDLILELLTANPSVSTQSGNYLSWDFVNLHPFESREILFTLYVNSPTSWPPVGSGNVLSYSATISSASIDGTPSDNTFALNQIVVNAFDPNEKVCLEGSTIAPEKVGDFVHYIIRFENDGTANAQNIVVKDLIDTTKFDIDTLFPESGSASYSTRIINTNQVEFVFQDINLPFTAGTNTGYVAFKIKTKPTLVLGNTFSNTASIYFDYNFPIITNTATTTIQALATQDFEFGNYFTLYPNPAKNVLNISTKQSIEVHSLTIYNLLGQVMLAIPNAQNLNTIDVSSLKTGNYFLKITSDKGSATEKFMKE